MFILNNYKINKRVKECDAPIYKPILGSRVMNGLEGVWVKRDSDRGDITDLLDRLFIDQHTSPPVHITP